jgi:hypothetical protein
MKPGRILLLLLFLVVGFFAGQAWKSETQSDSLNQTVGGTDDDATPIDERRVKVILENEEATIRLFEQSAPSVAYIT